MTAATSPPLTLTGRPRIDLQLLAQLEAGSPSQTPGVHGSGIVAGLISQYPRNEPRARNDRRPIIPSELDLCLASVLNALLVAEQTPPAPEGDRLHRTARWMIARKMPPTVDLTLRSEIETGMASMGTSSF